MMPNLETFIFKAPFKRDEMLFRKFIKKLLSRNVKNIDFKVKSLYHKNNDEFYSEQELENICKGIDNTKLEDIEI